MKIRQGFVSNSSSTSFVMYGICINSTDMYEELDDKSNNLSCFLDDDCDKIYIGTVFDVEGCPKRIDNYNFRKEETKKKLKDMLEPMNLWDEKYIGIYAGTVEY